MQVKEEWKGMQYTDLTRKELQREYSRLTRTLSASRWSWT